MAPTLGKSAVAAAAATPADPVATYLGDLKDEVAKNTKADAKDPHPFRYSQGWISSTRPSTTVAADGPRVCLPTPRVSAALSWQFFFRVPDAVLSLREPRHRMCCTPKENRATRLCLSFNHVRATRTRT